MTNPCEHGRRIEKACKDLKEGVDKKLSVERQSRKESDEKITKSIDRFLDRMEVVADKHEKRLNESIVLMTENASRTKSTEKLLYTFIGLFVGILGWFFMYMTSVREDINQIKVDIALNKQKSIITKDE